MFNFNKKTEKKFCKKNIVKNLLRQRYGFLTEKIQKQQKVGYVSIQIK